MSPRPHYLTHYYGIYELRYVKQGLPRKRIAFHAIPRFYAILCQITFVVLVSAKNPGLLRGLMRGLVTALVPAEDHFSIDADCEVFIHTPSAKVGH